VEQWVLYPRAGEDVNARIHPDSTIQLMPGKACRQ